MSPEELEAAREGANVDYAPDISYDDWQAMARALLAHIDSQAVTINNLAAALDEAKVDQVNFSSACQEELDTQAAQIETLKEDIEVMKLGEKAADDSDTGGAMSNSVDICPFDDDLTCPLDYHTCEIYRERMEEEQANHLYEKYRLPGDALAGEIERLRSEIEALKEKLVEEVAWSHFNEERLGARQDVSFSDIAEEHRRKARQQLKADPDLQGVTWE